jgi:hypothetical protein
VADPAAIAQQPDQAGRWADSKARWAFLEVEEVLVRTHAGPETKVIVDQNGAVVVSVVAVMPVPVRAGLVLEVGVQKVAVLVDLEHAAAVDSAVRVGRASVAGSVAAASVLHRAVDLVGPAARQEIAKAVMKTVAVVQVVAAQLVAAKSAGHATAKVHAAMVLAVVGAIGRPNPIAGNCSSSIPRLRNDA